ncbi:hypothetical protein LEP1GSC193_4394 [Leptospira alstonii serovar Pingchang str. 80-412]|uniref:Uncharacterized protein n=2 Tax=Leptospira alstonii TaxID=28452 RepID=M6D570_9LEPT|nr:hypothetical protein LEP1GSC194_0584 [Leptospira alstonii serovar Sichuan str. 79601]EQA80362.1 hypothetical protein LEP1GSC193_4394 [Leptospira alstonii serovar Pingchang str. 80-412]
MNIPKSSSTCELVTALANRTAKKNIEFKPIFQPPNAR